MTVYRGFKHSGGMGHQLVTKDDDILSPIPSQKLYNHSPDGFSWGYGGSGPAQLALALLYDATGDKEISLRNHQQFKWTFVANWQEDWHITSDEILAWLKV
ncbi:unnamed protein product, partial [marine sediment metagenome]